MSQSATGRKKQKKDRALEAYPSSSRSQDEEEIAVARDGATHSEMLRKNGDDATSKRKRKRKEVEAPQEETDEEDLEMDAKSKRQARSEALADPEMGEWTSEQDGVLLDFITKQLVDSKINRIDKIDWSKASIPEQSHDRCARRANHIAGHIRRIKTLQEVFAEAAELHAKDPCAFNYLGGRFSRNKKRKRLVDEPAPPPSAYMLFSKVKMKKLQLKNPTGNISVFGKQMGEEWRQMSDKKKGKYFKKATEARVKYEEEMKEFWEKHPELKAQKRTVMWPLDAPVKPKTAYVIFVEMWKDKVEGSSMKEKRAKLSEMFRRMTKDEKEQYIVKSMEDKDRFKIELADYYKLHPERKDLCEQSLGRKKAAPVEVTGKKKVEIPFDKPPPTTYLLYSQMRRNELKKHLKEDEMIDFTTFSRKIGREWQKFPKEEKEKLAQKLEKKKKKYEKELLSFLETLSEEDRATVEAQMAKEVKPGVSMAGFNTFSKSKRLEVKAAFPGEVTQKITKRLKNLWCESTPEERLKWKNIEESLSLEKGKKRVGSDSTSPAVEAATPSTQEEKEEEDDDDDDDEEEEESDESEPGKNSSSSEEDDADSSSSEECSDSESN